LALIDSIGCYENCAASAAHGRGRAGRQVASRKTLLQRFLLATTAGKVFPQPPDISAHQWFKNECLPLRSAITRYLREKLVPISAH
jgi:hypothetical protein